MSTPQEIIQCIQDGACVYMSKTLSDLYLVGAVVALVSTFLVIVMLWKTPAVEFLWAIMTGKPVVYVYNRSQRGKFRVGSIQSDGVMNIRNVGPCMVTENSHTVEATSGRPLFFMFGEFAATLPVLWISCVNRIKNIFSKKGKAMSNVSHLGYTIGLEFDEQKGAWKKLNKKAGEEKGTVEIEEEIKIPAFQTVRLHDLANMFPFNITPALIESRMAHVVAMKQKLWNALTAQFFFAAGVFLIFAVVGAYLAWKFFGGGTPEVHVVVDTAGNLISSNTTFNG